MSRIGRLPVPVPTGVDVTIDGQDQEIQGNVVCSDMGGNTNIAIGTAYLRQLLNTYGLPYVTIAAYNAGPGRVARLGHKVLQHPVEDHAVVVTVAG